MLTEKIATCFFTGQAVIFTLEFMNKWWKHVYVPCVIHFVSFLSVIVCTIIATLHSSLLINLFLCCVAGGADEVSSVDTLKLFLGHWCSPLRQRSGLITALTALRETSVVGFFTHSKWSLLLLTAFAGFKEGTLYLPPIFWTELSLNFSQPCKKRKNKL